MKNLIMTTEGSAAGAGSENIPNNSSTVAPVQADESAVSSMSDLSTNSKRNVVKKWNLSMNLDGSGYQNEGNSSVAESSGTGTSIKHVRAHCLLCCRHSVSNKITKSAGSLPHEGIGKLLPPPQPPPQMIKNLADVSFHSPESILSDESNIQERVTGLILRNVEKMGNPAYHKHGKQVLLELKQKYPKCFQDICLYSEVCKLLSQSTYRTLCRRFIQEIFFDMNYEPLHEDLDGIVSTINDRLADNKLMELYHHLLEQTMIESKPPQPSTSQQAIAAHKLHAALKSPQLASVYETSVENLVEKSGSDVPSSPSPAPPVALSTPKRSEFLTIVTKAQVEVRPASSRIEEKSHNRHSSIDLNDLNRNSAGRRRRFNTLELDLSCTKNKFPLTHRTKDFSPTTGTGVGLTNSTFNFSSYSSFIRSKQQQSSSVKDEKSGKDDDTSFMSNLSSNSSVINLNNSNIDTSNANPRRTSSTDIILRTDNNNRINNATSTPTTKSLSTVTSPTSPPPRLFCEERLLTSSKSEATLSKKNFQSNSSRSSRNE